MSIDQKTSSEISSPEIGAPEISLMLDRLVNEFGYANASDALKVALENLIEDHESNDSDQDPDRFVEELREAIADIENGDRGRPASEVFEELRREFNISTDT